jgi:hypothetical protein
MQGKTTPEILNRLENIFVFSKSILLKTEYQQFINFKTLSCSIFHVVIDNEQLFLVNIRKPYSAILFIGCRKSGSWGEICIFVGINNLT